MSIYDNVGVQCYHLKAKGLSRAEIAETTGLTDRQVKTRLTDQRLKALYLKSVSANSSPDIAPTTAGKREITLDDIFGSNGRVGTDQTILSQVINGRQPKLLIKTDKGRDIPDFEVLEKDELLFSSDIFDERRGNIKSHIEKKYYDKKMKLLNLSDLHVPFTDYETVSEIVKKNSDADVCLINGDLLDLFSVSRFAHDKDVALKRELKEAYDFLLYVSKVFKDVVVTDGNHERRLRNYIVNAIPQNMQFLFPTYILDCLKEGSVINRAALPDNVHFVGSWWINIYDSLFAHPDNYSVVNLRTVQNVSEHFKLIKGIDHKLTVIGHTHQAGWMVRGGVKIMESGCLCYDMDYHNGSRFVNSKWTKAYGVINYDYGKVNQQTSNIILV